ncbi:hypothetical protein BLOT_002912 [Blomia tropicalis]|nr:hypothetical protein BLOT_002912 [Blomia tropicalis]
MDSSHHSGHHTHPPFFNTGIDLFGPLRVKLITLVCIRCYILLRYDSGYCSTIYRSIITDEDLPTSIVEIESFIKSRPLFVHENETITPNHFFRGTSLRTIPPVKHVFPNRFFLSSTRSNTYTQDAIYTKNSHSKLFLYYLYSHDYTISSAIK